MNASRVKRRCSPMREMASKQAVQTTEPLSTLRPSLSKINQSKHESVKQSRLSTEITQKPDYFTTKHPPPSPTNAPRPQGNKPTTTTKSRTIPETSLKTRSTITNHIRPRNNRENHCYKATKLTASAQQFEHHYSRYLLGDYRARCDNTSQKFHSERSDMKAPAKRAHRHIHYPHQRHLLLQFLFVLIFTVTAISSESITSTNLLRRVVRGQHDDDYGPYVGMSSGPAGESQYSQEYSALEELTSALKRIFPVIPERGLRTLRAERALLSSRAKHYIESSEDEADNNNNDPPGFIVTTNNVHSFIHQPTQDNQPIDGEINDQPDMEPAVKREDRTQPEEVKRDTMIDVQKIREMARLNNQRQRMQKLAQQQQQQQQLQQQRDHRFMRMLLRKLKNRGKNISGLNTGGSLHKPKDAHSEPVGGNGADSGGHGFTSGDLSDVESNRTGSGIDSSQKVSATLATHSQYRPHQFETGGRSETETGAEQTETATPSTLGKRGPECMRRCILQGLLHPVQCHSLC